MRHHMFYAYSDDAIANGTFYHIVHNRKSPTVYCYRLGDFMGELKVEEMPSNLKQYSKDEAMKLIPKSIR